MNFEVVSTFEKKIADFFGAPYAITIDSCTHGLELCLRYMKENRRQWTCYFLNVLKYRWNSLILNLFYLNELCDWYKENFANNRYGDPTNLIFQKAIGKYSLNHVSADAYNILENK